MFVCCMKLFIFIYLCCIIYTYFCNCKHYNYFPNHLYICVPNLFENRNYIFNFRVHFPFLSQSLFSLNYLENIFRYHFPFLVQSRFSFRVHFTGTHFDYLSKYFTGCLIWIVYYCSHIYILITSKWGPIIYLFSVLNRQCNSKNYISEDFNEY